MFFILTDSNLESKRDEDAEKDWQRVGEAERERPEVRGRRLLPHYPSCGVSPMSMTMIMTLVTMMTIISDFKGKNIIDE